LDAFSTGNCLAGDNLVLACFATNQE
jgi:hypothetical protein